ncbi:DUF1569 domain-containing protein [Gimesia aquarii]|uniref:DinB superfamily protein n=1 Tax=Gimesia aquarii TaxID=2527964 RepID=A0A517WQD0_9PLAN|nr:DUF1569 domain-containing protein [Gimesia aquarii]QDU07465.1 hypothetical protein V202x_08200 [Gimesia aquarii]
MPINTKTVQDRRDVHYNSMDQLLKDAELMVVGPSRTLGNWSLGQILEHLAITMHKSIDDFPALAPWPLRVMIKLTMKQKFLTQPMPAGFQISSKMEAVRPKEHDAVKTLSELHEAIERLKQETPQALNPGLGRLTVDEWNAFHLRHAELHMSFVTSE